jgi:hypothetical protein
MKNYRKLLRKFNETERVCLESIYKKLFKSRSLNREDVYELRHFSSCTFEEVCRVFRIPTSTLYSWIEEGCPCDQEHHTYDISQIHAWILERECRKLQPKSVERGLRNKILYQQIRRMEMELEIDQKKYVRRSDMEKTLESREKSLRLFLKRAFPLYEGCFEGKNSEGIRAELRALGQEVMEAYTSGMEYPRTEINRAKKADPDINSKEFRAGLPLGIEPLFFAD